MGNATSSSTDSGGSDDSNSQRRTSLMSRSGKHLSEEEPNTKPRLKRRGPRGGGQQQQLQQEQHQQEEQQAKEQQSPNSSERPAHRRNRSRKLSTFSKDQRKRFKRDNKDQLSFSKTKAFRVDKYRVTRLLGEGSQAKVYLCSRATPGLDDAASGKALELSDCNMKGSPTTYLCALPIRLALSRNEDLQEAVDHASCKTPATPNEQGSTEEGKWKRAEHEEEAEPWCCSRYVRCACKVSIQ